MIDEPSIRRVDRQSPGCRTIRRADGSSDGRGRTSKDARRKRHVRLADRMNNSHCCSVCSLSGGLVGWQPAAFVCRVCGKVVRVLGDVRNGFRTNLCSISVGSARTCLFFVRSRPYLLRSDCKGIFIVLGKVFAAAAVHHRRVRATFQLEFARSDSAARGGDSYHLPLLTDRCFAIAKRAGPDYEMKEYNRASLYWLLVAMTACLSRCADLGSPRVCVRGVSYPGPQHEPESYWPAIGFW